VFYLLDLGASKGQRSPPRLTQLARWHNGTLCCSARLPPWLLPRGDINSQKHLCTSFFKPGLFLPNFLVCLEFSSVLSFRSKIQHVLPSLCWGKMTNCGFNEQEEALRAWITTLISRIAAFCPRLVLPNAANDSFLKQLY